MRAVDAGVDNAALTDELLARLGMQSSDATRPSG